MVQKERRRRLPAVYRIRRKKMKENLTVLLEMATRCTILIFPDTRKFDHPHLCSELGNENEAEEQEEATAANVLFYIQFCIYNNYIRSYTTREHRHMIIHNGKMVYYSTLTIFIAH